MCDHLKRETTARTRSRDRRAYRGRRVATVPAGRAIASHSDLRPSPRLLDHRSGALEEEGAERVLVLAAHDAGLVGLELAAREAQVDPALLVRPAVVEGVQEIAQPVVVEVRVAAD